MLPKTEEVVELLKGRIRGKLLETVEKTIQISNEKITSKSPDCGGFQTRGNHSPFLMIERQRGNRYPLPLFSRLILSGLQKSRERTSGKRSPYNMVSNP